MEIFVRAIYENEKDRLWDSKLKRLIRDRYFPSLSGSSFRCAKKKLIEVGLITVEKLPSKKKKARIQLSEAARDKYLFGDLHIPNTYLSREEAKDREFNYLRRLSKKRRRKEIEESEGASRERIVQYYLLRTPGTTYARRVTDRLEQGLPGLIWTYVDKNGRSYSYEDIEYTLTEKQKESLVPVILDTVTAPGVSVMDLVEQRDIGSGGFFKYVRPSKEECEPIVQDLVDKKVLVRMTYEEIHDAIANIEHSEVYRFLLEEPRYKIASQALSEFIADRNDLQYFFTKRFEAVSLIPPDMRQKEFESQCYSEQHDGYQYYLGLRITNNLRTRQKVEHKKMLLEEKDNRKRKVDRKVIEAYSNERSKWDDCIKHKLKEIRNKQEYAEIRNEYPSLHEVLIKPLRNISRALGLDERKFGW